MTGQKNNSIVQKQEWHWPINIEQYDRALVLSEEEWAAIDLFRTFGSGQQWSSYPVEVNNLKRLMVPINDVLAMICPYPKKAGKVRKDMLRGMYQQQSSFWGWNETEWIEVIKPAYHVRHHLVAIAYLLRGLTNLHHNGKCVWQAYLAAKIFGQDLIDEAVSSIRDALQRLGYHSLAIKHSRHVLCEALLLNHSPLLQDLTAEALEKLRHSTAAKSTRKRVVMLSRALVSLGILTQPLALGSPYTAEIVARGEMGVSPDWLSWCQRWRDTVVVRPSTRKGSYVRLLKVGRWLNSTHPEVVSPEQWTRELAVEFVAAISRMKIGEHLGNYEHLEVRKLIGKPIKAGTIDSCLGTLRKFFSDCQEWGWIQRNFDPGRALKTPRSIRASVGPDPRVIADDIWAKLMWAGLNLQAADLPHTMKKASFYPLEMVGALVITWLFAGLRLDEIRRLRVGCIRWQHNDAVISGNDNELSKGLVCLLDVPISKTGTAFTKAVDRVVGDAIATWEKIRYEQPPRVEAKTGEMAHYLFSHRGWGVGDNYLNKSLIPSLCQKAGVPTTDVRGRITSHRARSTIASQLYSAKEPMSLFELQQWLGHCSPSSTQYYARISPTKMSKSYADAGYFERNIRTIKVLIDRDAILSGQAASGAPWEYFDLGHGFCTNSFFVTCPHRMACAKCDFYLPKSSTTAQMLEAKGNLQQMLQNIPLTEEECTAVEEGIEYLEKLCEKLADLPTPAGPTPRELKGRGALPLIKKTTEGLSKSTLQD
jgi:integrase